VTNIITYNKHYGCETWKLSERDVNSLLVFERQILRRIYGLVEGWKMRNNDKLEKLMKRRRYS
jgi:hypothetical protein